LKMTSLQNDDEFKAADNGLSTMGILRLYY